MQIQIFDGICAEQIFTKLSRTICGQTRFTGLTGAGARAGGTAVAGTAVAGTAVAGPAVASTEVASTEVAVEEDWPVLKLALIPTASSEPKINAPHQREMHLWRTHQLSSATATCLLSVVAHSGTRLSSSDRSRHHRTSLRHAAPRHIECTSLTAFLEQFGVIIT